MYNITYQCGCAAGDKAQPDKHADWCPASRNEKTKEVKMKNLHHVFLVLGILLGFWMFGSIARESGGGAMILYLMFYAPAFFGGLFSGKDRAAGSDLHDMWTDMVNALFKLNLDYHICTR